MDHHFLPNRVATTSHFKPNVQAAPKLVNPSKPKLLSGKALVKAELAKHDDPHVAAKKFETLLAAQLVKEMSRSLEGGFFGQGTGSDVYEGWLEEHLSAALTQGRGLGLTDAVAKSLGEKHAAEVAARAAEQAAGNASLTAAATQGVMP